MRTTSATDAPEAASRDVVEAHEAHRPARAPAPRSELVGRDGELVAIDALFAGGARAVTLVGAPGVGKTALARAFAAAAVAPVWWIDAAAARSVDELLVAAAGALDLQLHAASADDGAAQLGRALAAPGRGLLVVDDLEAVAAAGAALLGRWLDAAPRLRVLVTSRFALGLDGEVRCEVAPLAADAAVELLGRRIVAVRPAFRMTGAEYRHAAAIVERLDRIPLAIELAAARAGVLSLAELDERLVDAGALLWQSRPHAAGKRASLAEAIAWSWDLLDPAEQHALARCTVFHGGFTATAAEAVLHPRDPDDGRGPLELLDRLVACSLVRRVEGPDGAPRFELYGAVARFAAERLEPAARADAEARHAGHHAACVVRWGAAALGPRRAEAAGRFADELGNVVAAHRHALAHDPIAAIALALAADPLLDARGPLPVHRAMLDASLAAAEAAALPAATAALLAARAELNASRGGFADALADVERASGLSDSATPAVRARLALAAGMATVRWDVARGRARLAGTSTGDARVRALGDMWQALAATVDRRYADAERGFTAALAVARAAGLDAFEPRILNNLAVARHLDGRLDDAAFAYAQALVGTALGRDVIVEVHARLGLAALAAERGDHASTDRELAAVRALAGAAGMAPRIVVFCEITAAAIAADRGGVEAARDAVARATALARDGGYDDGPGVIELGGGFVDVALGQAGDAAARAAAARAAQARLARAPEAGSVDARVVARLLVHAVDRLAHAPAEVAIDGRWFRVDGGAPIALGRRRVLARILAALARAHLDAPGAPLGLGALRAAGWPEEHMRAESAARRAYVAIADLRKLGLHEHIVTSTDGYRLSDGVRVRA